MQDSLTGRPAAVSPPAELELPEVQILDSCSVNYEFYGALVNAAQYCGFKQPPTTPRGSWPHGWGPKQWLEFDDPMLYFGPVDLKGKTDHHWVSRRDEADLLCRHGYKKVKAIGLPIVYAPTESVRRRPGSLLVMPAHSGDDSTSEWKLEEYAEEIARIRANFSEVWVCIHPSCWEHGYWVDAFKKRGFPLVQGALYTDRNALKRMVRLLSTFEYVTTNGTGSHIAYAAYAGAKVSIYGSFAEFGGADLNDIPEKLPYKDRWAWAYSEKTMRHYYPELFCPPREAKQRIDWGRYEVGCDNKVSPAELRSLFGWTRGARLVHRTRGLVRRVSGKASEGVRAVMPYRFVHRAKMIRDAEYRRNFEIHAELDRLDRVPRYTAASTNIFGGRFELVDSKSFISQYKAIFQQQIYRFDARKEEPLIIDGGANVGLSMLYFKRSFPRSRIIAFEPDPDVFQALAKNCAAFQLENVQLVPQALWTKAGAVKFDREGADAGRIAADTESLQAVEISACRLKDYLQQDVDLLKLDLEGAELDVLLDCAEVLGNVDKVVVEYHSFKDQPQKFHLLTQVLHDAGFRLHINSGMVSRQPLWWRQVHKGMDMRLYVYGFRS
jgi:FkbM family methyltransferase